jgi:hypothetical protein
MPRSFGRIGIGRRWLFAEVEQSLEDWARSVRRHDFPYGLANQERVILIRIME